MTEGVSTMVNINDPTNWQRRLAGEQVVNHSETPDFGYYRVKSRDKITWDPVAFWWDDKTGELKSHRNGRDVRENDICPLWTFALENPITEEIYFSVLDGGQWPDINEVVAGHNKAPVDGDPAAIADRIEDFAREAERMIKAGVAPSKDTADHASDVANTLGELEAKAVALHKIEKQPHLDAGRAVDKKWFGLRDRAADLKHRLKLIVLTPFLEKVEEETKKAQVAAVQSGTAPEALPPSRITAGSSKRSTGLRTYYRATIEDKAALIESLKDHPDLLACIQKIADAAAAKKIAMPGCKVIEEKRAA